MSYGTCGVAWCIQSELVNGHHLNTQPYEAAMGKHLDLVDAPMQRGDIVLFSGMLPHRGQYIQRLDFVRWSADLRYQATGTPSGRPQWPSFVVRSVAAPETEDRDPAMWRAHWRTSVHAH